MDKEYEKYKMLTVRVRHKDDDETVEFDLFPSEQAIAEKLGIPLEDYIKAKFDLIVKEK